MPAYKEFILKGVATVMVSYSSLNGTKMHAHKALITDYLKNTLKFQGIVISDWMGIDKITNPPHSNYSYSVLAGIQSGIDMVGKGLALLNGTTILKGTEATVDKNTEVVFNENPDSKFMESNKFDYAIVVTGEKPYAETFGDNQNLTIPAPGKLSFTWFKTVDQLPMNVGDSSYDPLYPFGHGLKTKGAS
ncbi:hypothetical protein FNV43_RR15502 [Rhamnella rubrinervis]|uniref:Glycoside hydrolase family 3 N-terminal domain-containing protein n=1 Tax=Rhamnella rubrinervis TaxID=2594499 RepID=A0A8K0E7W3_9ROSA|nr:hypothetical protein FNV43_RR15502 [Rhamnella rubrinervis]